MHIIVITKKCNDEETHEVVRNMSSLTHSHPISILECYIYVKYMINLLSGMDKKQSYKESILMAVNLGDDTDTVGAITGSIAGFIYGINDILNNWIMNLKKKNELVELATTYENKLSRGEIK